MNRLQAIGNIQERIDSHVAWFQCGDCGQDFYYAATTPGAEIISDLERHAAACRSRQPHSRAFKAIDYVAV